MKSRRVVATVLITTIGVLACQRTDRASSGDSASDTVAAGTSDSARHDVTSDVRAGDTTRAASDTGGGRAGGNVPTGTTGAARGGNAGVPPAPLSRPLADTARGVVQRIGNDPLSVLVLQPSPESDSPLLALTGPAELLLGDVIGAEVMVSGRQTSDVELRASPRGAPKFVVDSFVVRAVDGREAHDGVLQRTGSGFQLRLADGTVHAIQNLPRTLERHVGDRVFLVGPLPSGPFSFGVIR